MQSASRGWSGALAKSTMTNARNLYAIFERACHRPSSATSQHAVASAEVAAAAVDVVHS